MSDYRIIDHGIDLSAVSMDDVPSCIVVLSSVPERKQTNVNRGKLEV